MSGMIATQATTYRLLFEGCPEPCGVIEGDSVVARNDAFRKQFGDAESLRACIDALDHDKLPGNIATSCKFTARLSVGANVGKHMAWTAWPIEGSVICLRLDGPAGSDIPLALAPMFVHEHNQARALLSAVAELPVTVWAMEPDGTCTLSVGKGLRHFGLKSGDLVGKNLLQVYPANSETHQDILKALQGEQLSREIRIGEMTWYSTILPIRDALGQGITHVYGVAENVTERSQAQRHIEEQLALIASQQEAIAALTSPIIEVWQGVLVVPVIGSLDGDRASRLLENLLAAVVNRQSRAVILDLTGTQVVDPSTAQNLFDIMRSIRLLGSEGLVSGIRPNVAKAMVELDIASTSWKTYPTLAEALRQIIGQRASKR